MVSGQWPVVSSQWAAVIPSVAVPPEEETEGLEGSRVTERVVVSEEVQQAAVLATGATQVAAMKAPVAQVQQVAEILKRKRLLLMRGDGRVG